jgi:tetratricopeptide (TPR) repeat protein
MRRLLCGRFVTTPLLRVDLPVVARRLTTSHTAVVGEPKKRRGRPPRKDASAGDVRGARSSNTNAKKRSGKMEQKQEEDDDDDVGVSPLDPDVEALGRLLGGANTKSDLDESYERFRVPIMMAEEHLEKGRYAEAIALYEETARKFAPNYYFGDLYMGIGCAYMGLEQPQMAVEQFEKGLTFDPLNVHIWMNLGIAQVSANDLAGAVETFDDARAIAVEAREEHMAQQCALYVGQISEDLGNEARALQVYGEALAMSPGYSQIWYLKGCLLHKQGHHAEAIRDFEEAIRCTVVWPSAYYKLSKLVSDPQEKKTLFNKFIAAQKEMAESGEEPEALTKAKV